MPQAVTELRRLDKPIAQRIINKLKWLSHNFDDFTPQPLSGELKGFYKLRIGSYRTIYTANRGERLLMVHLIGHRRNIYKR
jgi:mRNA interferase RelE/StbE